MEQRTKFKFVVYYLMMSGNISPKSPHSSSVNDKYNLSVFSPYIIYFKTRFAREDGWANKLLTSDVISSFF